MSSPGRAVVIPEGPAKSAPHAVNPARALRLQRACACGGQCESCKKKNEAQHVLQRKAVAGAPAPPVAAPRAPAVPPHASTVVPSTPANAPSAAPAAAKAAPKPHANVPKTPEPKAAAKPPASPKPAALKPPEHAAGAKDKPKSATPAITEKKKSAGDATSDLPPIVHRVLDTPGEPLDFATRTGMEARFGHSFRDVRIHTDALAAESARAVYAHAYTVGEHIVFASGQYRPETAEGRHLLAHELAHTIQQHGLQKSGRPIANDNSGEYQHMEREAENVARSVMRTPEARSVPVTTRDRSAQTAEGRRLFVCELSASHSSF